MKSSFSLKILVFCLLAPLIPGFRAALLYNIVFIWVGPGNAGMEKLLETKPIFETQIPETNG